MNYEETVGYIHSLGNFKRPAGLERIKAAMDYFSNPQNGFRSVHIAGTNGKGSTAAMLARIFKEAGLKTGLFISPYIINFRERIQINGSFISESDLADYAGRIIASGIDLSEFELITAAAFLYFSEKKCDIVVAETGLGGRLDATNVLNNTAAAVITRIGLDHSEILGDTVEKIAAEKCGIIKDCPLTVASPCQEHAAERVIEKYSSRLIVPDVSRLEVLHCGSDGSEIIYKGKEYKISLPGGHQIENALTAIETAANCGLGVSYEAVRNALADTFFPARAEIISVNPRVVLDGAHNPDGAAALAKILEKQGGRVTAVIGMMRDKDCRSVLKTTLIHCRAAVAVAVEGMSRSLSAGELSRIAGEYCPCAAAESYKDAVRKAYELSEGGPVFVFGSLYLAGGIREELTDFYKNLK